MTDPSVRAGCRFRRGAPLCLGLAGLLLAPHVAAAQAEPAKLPAVRPIVEFGDKGLVFNAADGFSYLALRFRVQEVAGLTTNSDNDLDVASTQLVVRRARLRLESVAWDPRLKMTVQLAFSRGDMDFDAASGPNVVRDAVLSFQATPRLALMLGQTKLPGNRQRVVSSGALQFAERSIVNSAFTVDRDVGFFMHYVNTNADLPFNLRGAITSGEGRNPLSGGSGLAYTARVELLPLGVFTGGGDYIEGDLRREPAPRLSIAAGISHNDRAVRTGGQLGLALFTPRSMTTTLVDVLYKYHGWSISGEVARRTSPNPITTSGATTRYITVGGGVTAQASYIFANNLEPVVRYSEVRPESVLAGLAGADRQREVSLGLTAYLKEHKVKWQWELLHDDFRNAATAATHGSWGLKTSFEFGI